MRRQSEEVTSATPTLEQHLEQASQAQILGPPPINDLQPYVQEVHL